MFERTPSLSAWFPAAIALGALLAFWPALRNNFIHDDRNQVLELSIPASAAEWLSVPAQPWWPPSHQKNLWRPLTRSTILLQKAIHGNTAWAFFAVNIALHAMVAILLWRVARRLGLSDFAAFFCGLVFAIHPVHAEAVHQVVGRAEILSALWMLVGLLAWKAPTPRSYWRQPLCFALALFSKESAVVYPFLLALFALATGGPAVVRVRAFWLNILLLTAVLALFLAGKAAVTGGLLESAASVPFHENPMAHMSFAARLPAGLGILVYAASQLVLPFGLSPDYSAYSLPVESGWRWPLAWVGLFAAVALSIYMVRSARTGRRGWMVAAAALGSWLPLSNIPFPIGTVTAERLWYIPSLPACIFLGWLVSILWSITPSELTRIRSTRILATALLISWLMTSLVYARAWRTQAGYAAWTVRRFPESWRGHVGLAREYYLVKQFEEGLAEARVAVKLMPRIAIGWDWLGVNAAFMGAAYWDESESALRRALEVDPSLAEAHQHLATLYEIQGRRADAIRELEIYLASGQAMRPDTVRKRLERLRNS